MRRTMNIEPKHHGSEPDRSKCDAALWPDRQNDRRLEEQDEQHATVQPEHFPRRRGYYEHREDCLEVSVRVSEF